MSAEASLPKIEERLADGSRMVLHDPDTMGVPRQHFAPSDRPAGFWVTWRMILTERFAELDKDVALDIQSRLCPPEGARYALTQLHRARERFAQYDAQLRELLVPHRTEATLFALETPLKGDA